MILVIAFISLFLSAISAMYFLLTGSIILCSVMMFAMFGFLILAAYEMTFVD